MAEEKKLVPVNPPPQQMQYPCMVISAIPNQGVLVEIVQSVLEKSSFLIPAQNADRMCVEWLGDRSKEVLKAVLNYRHQRELENKLISEAVKHPTRLQA